MPKRQIIEVLSLDFITEFKQKRLFSKSRHLRDGLFEYCGDVSDLKLPFVKVVSEREVDK